MISLLTIVMALKQRLSSGTQMQFGVILLHGILTATMKFANVQQVSILQS